MDDSKELTHPIEMKDVVVGDWVWSHEKYRIVKVISLDRPNTITVASMQDDAIWTLPYADGLVVWSMNHYKPA